jgi:Resolvase, N terminal domain
VIWAVREKGYSQRRACRLVGLHPAVAKRWHVVPRYALPALGMALGDGQEARWFTKPRLGRSLQDLVGFLSELRALGVDLFLHQQGLDTTTPAGKAMFQMLGVFAEFERAMIQERVRAGLARAKSEGKRLGRPRIPAEVEERIRKALSIPGRPGVRKIAERFGVDPGTVQRISRPFEARVADA